MLMDWLEEALNLRILRLVKPGYFGHGLAAQTNRITVIDSVAFSRSISADAVEFHLGLDSLGELEWIGWGGIGRRLRLGIVGGSIAVPGASFGF